MDGKLGKIGGVGDGGYSTLDPLMLDTRFSCGKSGFGLWFAPQGISDLLRC